MNNVTISKIVGKNGVFVDGDWVESKDQDPQGSVRLIQLADIGDGVFINKSKRFLTAEKAKELRCTFLQPGDILIARMPEPIGRACIFPELEMPCVTVVDVCIIRPDKNLVLPEWLKFLINSPTFRNRINQYITGTTRQRISRGNLEKIRFELPSILDQKNVVAILTEAETLRSKRKLTIPLIDNFVKSTFNQMFGDVIHGKNETNEKLTKLVDLINGRAFKSTEWSDSGLPIIRIQNLKDSTARFNYFDGEFSESHLVKKGDLLMSWSGQIVSFGTFIWDGSDALLNQHIFNVKPLIDIDKTYLKYALDQLIDYAKNNFHGIEMKHLTKSELSRYSISLPTKADQKRFSDIVSDSIRIKDKMHAQAVQLDLQFQSLMQRSFNYEN